MPAALAITGFGLNLARIRHALKDREPLALADEARGRVHPDQARVALPRAKQLFVSFDLDLLDAAHAPGVSAVNPAGWSVREAEAWVQACGADRRVRCFDLMELNPNHDLDGRTARVAAHLFLTFLTGFSTRK